MSLGEKGELDLKKTRSLKTKAALSSLARGVVKEGERIRMSVREPFKREKTSIY